MSTEEKKLAQYIASLGVKNKEVLEALELVPRRQFVSPQYRFCAYEDEALPIECGQTLSQPSLVARMTELILGDREKVHRMLEIGTGSGYQAALLSHVADDVYSVERVGALLDQARQRFESLKLDNIHTLHGDGFLGWKKYAPYDGIIVTAAAQAVPQNLLEQLSEAGGCMVIPIGQSAIGQVLQLITRQKDTYETQSLDAVVFVPMLPGTVDQ